MSEPRTLLTGLVLGESPRWHDGRLWLCDWGAQELIAVGPDGAGPEVVLRVPAFPFCIDWLPDGRLLIVDGSGRRLLRRDGDGPPVTHADLGPLSDRPWNEVVADGRGNAYVNGVGFDLMAGEAPAPGLLALVTPDGAVRRVAGDLAFPNGMAVTPDGSTLIVAESYAGRLTAFRIEPDGSLADRRVWAAVEGSAPDGICLDAEGALWYADVPNRACVRVREGGEVLARVESELGCFSCALGGEDGRTLYVTAAEWPGAADGTRSGRLLAVPAPAPRAPAPRAPAPRAQGPAGAPG
ncbi:SMP-30/gluconolactonase/LRE family protein [Kitasatospora sp. MBT63]|uniref:SMP-30/gluconolactonase/LRE family protein n=1 Tax=Kitasatospora sp. MBT63 TaxID=1444768 RepID=UPI00068B6F0D|nr:SMP-30/gluconolactonase/LRE family protein [Kitasatospora sp. MBT63]